jgi:branched-chain amino acid transport system substrate-binding protein
MIHKPGGKNMLASKSVIGITALTLATLVTGASAQRSNKEPIKIGVATDLSSTYAPLADQAVRAIKFAVDEAQGAGGVDGRPIEYKILDSESKPEVARRQLERLTLEGYHLLTGMVSSGETLAVAPLLERWNALYISTMSKGDTITGSECKPRLFRVIPNNSMDTAATKSWLSSREEKKWAIIAADITFARGSADLFKQLLKDTGRELAIDLYPAANTNDYAPFIEQIKASQPDGVWVVIGGRDAITFTQQAKQFGLIGSTTIAGVSYITDREAEQLGADSEGIYGIINYNATVDTPANVEFVKKWRAVYSADPSIFEGETYIGMQILFQAIQETGSVDPATLSDWLRGKTFNTLKGEAVMREDNQLLVPNYFGKVENYQGTYRPVIETSIPAEEVAPPVTCAF